MNKDAHSIFETYLSTYAKQEIIQEGLFDRLAARGAQAVGTVKGLGQQAAGVAKGAVAGVKGDTAGVQAAQQQRQAGAAAGEIAKINSYQKTAMQKLQKTADEIFADMKKLGIDVQKVSPKSMNVFTGQLGSAFEALKQQVSGSSTQQPTPQAQQSAQPAPQAQQPAPQAQQPAPQAQQPAPQAQQPAQPAPQAQQPAPRKQPTQNLNSPKTVSSIVDKKPLTKAEQEKADKDKKARDKLEKEKSAKQAEKNKKMDDLVKKAGERLNK